MSTGAHNLRFIDAVDRTGLYNVLRVKIKMIKARRLDFLGMKGYVRIISHKGIDLQRLLIVLESDRGAGRYREHDIPV